MNNIITKEEYLEFIKINADEKYKNFHQGLTNSHYKINGVRLPILKKKAKEISKMDNALEFLKWDIISYEHVMMQGFVIGFIKCSLKQKLQLLDKYINKIDDWSVNDSVSSLIKSKDEELFDFSLKQLNSDNPWRIRFGITLLMGNFIDDSHIDKAIEEIFKVSNDYYYIDMAKAWYIQNIAIKFEDKAKSLLVNKNVSSTIKKMAKQKIRDSRRTTLSLKEYVNNI